MNPVELGKDFIEKSRHTKAGAISLFVGGILTVSGTMAVGECFQNGNYDLALTGIPITAGEGATSLLIAGIAQKIEAQKDKTPLEEPNFPKTDSENLV